MKLILPILFSLALLAGCAAPAAVYRHISMEDAIALMETETDYIVLDVRTREEFVAGHIPGAINIPNESIGTEPLPALPDLDQLILVYCRSGNRSKTASAALAELGYTQIYEFGGINTWPYEVVE